MFSGSTLNLGANMSLFNSLDARDTATTINLNGYSLTAGSVYLGWSDGQPITLNRGGAGGTLDVNNLYVGNSTFNVLATDTVLALNLHNATSTLYSSVFNVNADTNSHLTTTATGSVTSFVSLNSGSTMSLGADLNLTNNLLINSGTTLFANGHGISAAGLYLGDGGNSPGYLNNNGTVTVNEVFMYNGSGLNLHGGDLIKSDMNLFNSSVITVRQTGGMGLTFTGSSLSDLNIDPTTADTMHLVFTPDSSPNWDFRWQESGGRRELGQRAPESDRLRPDHDQRDQQLHDRRPGWLHLHRRDHLVVGPRALVAAAGVPRRHRSHARDGGTAPA